jgi:hypothetical protein
MLPDIAIGAIVAAIIGALITLVGLIVSKESKVSEFRQAWIDSLRAELSSYLTNLSAVADARVIDFKDARERFEKLQPFYSKLNESYYMIAFRLNATEKPSEDLKSCMVRLSTAIRENNVDGNIIEGLKVEFINISNKLLKTEWKVVKLGERGFRATKWIIASFLIILIVLAGALALGGKSSPAKDPKIITIHNQ